MLPKSVLVANRGEIAIRVMRAAAEMGLRTVAIFSEDDANSLHTRKADEARALKGTGAAAYLDAEQVVAVAKAAHCDAIHPGYGFLSENAGFARRCREEGITFIGPRPEVLELFGDKLEARSLAARCGVPVLAGTTGATSLERAREFLSSLGPGGSMMIKAVAGGGGRGIREVSNLDEIEAAYKRCQSEARAAFGNGDVYAEQLMPRARHIEVQVAGDRMGTVSHLWERECSIQRRHQKLIEMAPSPGLAAGLRERLVAAAVRMAEAARYDNLGTVEFLVDATATGDQARFAFIEANPRLQVEHTVTEEVTGIDLVKLQLQLAGGQSLGELGLKQAEVPKPRGIAMQLRVNMETIGVDGSIKPSGGALGAFEAPSGPGIRVDSYGYRGYATNPRFDSLIAKLIVHAQSPDFAAVVAKAYRALCEFRIDGVATNIDFLQTLLKNPDFAANKIYTGFLDDHGAEIAGANRAVHRRFFFEPATAVAPRLAGSRINASDPLAVLDFGKAESNGQSAQVAAPVAPGAPLEGSDIAAPDGTVAVRAPIQGTIVSIDVHLGDSVHKGQQLFVMEAMKMEHVIKALSSGVVQRITVAERDAVFEGHPLAFMAETEVQAAQSAEREVVDLDHIRPDLAEVLERRAVGLDSARPDTVARRRKTGQRTARENIEDLCDPGSFVEYGPKVIAAQRRRRPVEELIVRTPADGMLAGIGQVNGDLFGDRKSRCIVMSYDYTVLAGTQGQQNHRKKDRMFQLADKLRLPVIFFTEGGGGRPGDTDGLGNSGLDVPAFHYFGKLSGLVPLVGINSGRCFAGNAALLGCCDVVIATANSNIGMGGPAMIEGGGLGIFRPEEVGPMEVQVRNGVVDIPVADEVEGVRVAKQYHFILPGSPGRWEARDQRLLRGIIPENRLRIYDVRR